MPNQSLARGVVLACIALAFGLSALQLPIGQLSHSGAGLFPLLTSGLLLLLAVIIIARSFATDSPPLYFKGKNIAIVLFGLIGFAVCSKLNMAIGILWLVFVTALSGNSYSWKRNLKITIALIVIALAFQKLLGLNLELV